MTLDQNISKLYQARFSERELERKNAIWEVICKDYLQQFILPDALVVDLSLIHI